MRHALLWEIIGIIAFGSLNTILIIMWLAMFWPADYLERILAGIVLMPVIWLVLLLGGFTASSFVSFFRVNCVLTAIFGIPVFWLLIV